MWIFEHNSVLCSVSVGASYVSARSVGEERYSAHLWFRKTFVNLPLIASSCELSYTLKITRFHKCSRKWQPTPVFFFGKLHRESMEDYSPPSHKESDATKKKHADFTKLYH